MKQLHVFKTYTTCSYFETLMVEEMFLSQKAKHSVVISNNLVYMNWSEKLPNKLVDCGLG